MPIPIGNDMASRITLDRSDGKALIYTFLTVGVTLTSTAGTADFALAVLLVQSLCLAIVVAVFCQWSVYYWFPEDLVDVDSKDAGPEKAKPVGNNNSN
jgi:hypothetical protein